MSIKEIINLKGTKYHLYKKYSCKQKALETALKINKCKIKTYIQNKKTENLFILYTNKKLVMCS